jgi:hypothetical protein
MPAWLIWTKERNGPQAKIYHEELPRVITQPTADERRNNPVIANYEIHDQHKDLSLTKLKQIYVLPAGFENG